MDGWEAGDRDFYLQQEACESDIWSGIFGNQGSKMSVWTGRARQTKGAQYWGPEQETWRLVTKLQQRGKGQWQAIKWGRWRWDRLTAGRELVKLQGAAFWLLWSRKEFQQRRDVERSGCMGSLRKARAGGSIPNITQEIVLTVSEIQKRRLILACPSVFFKPITLLTSPYLANSHTMFEIGSCLGSLLTPNRSLFSYLHPDI